MNCEWVESRITAYVDGLLEDEERRLLVAHLAACRRCALRSEQHRQLRASLRALPQRRPPQRLTTELRILASRERARILRPAGLAGMWTRLAESFALATANLMRPVAIPFAGGLVSAIVLFGVLAPMLIIRPASAIEDVPTGLTTEASVLSTISYGPLDEEIVVDVYIDEFGRMMDYSIPAGQQWSGAPEVRRSVENTLLCTKFTPATMFGQPASGKARITLRRSHMDVRG